MKRIRNKKGITLIALVVTIVVLLILAFVTIQILMKDGIVDKSKEAKEETIMAQEREYIKLAYQNLEMERMNNGEDITTDRVGNELKKYDEKTKTKGIQESEIGEKEVVVKKENGVGYAEIEYTETGHKYVVSLIMETNVSYSITYNLNGGIVSGNPVQYSPSETIKLNNPTQSWHKFIGWTGSNGTIPETMVTIPKGSTGNKEYTANWLEIEAICKIGETKYESIQTAIEACSKTAGETQTTITMLKNTEEEIKTYEGQNIILNLNGYTVKNTSTETPLCTNNGTLTIINGQLKSENGTTVLNKGTVTIGDNSTSIDANTPTIYGKQIGIKNEGTLNFYDGKVQGIIPIQGNVNDTPAEYGPVTTDYSNGITTLQLGIVNIYEARIGWVYYTKLQEAIDIAKAKETVTLIKDLQLKTFVKINENKNMTLDLDGNLLTVVSGIDTVIDNYGELMITDSNSEKTGKITISGNENKTDKKCTSAIYNNYSGKLTILGGLIENNSVKNSKRPCAIYNVSTREVIIAGGKISTIGNEITTYGIYNDNIGTIKITGGNIADNIITNGSTGTVHKDYGVYNASTGNIDILGGEINCINNSERVYNYGIYNFSTGNIKITEGTINCINNINSEYSYGIYNSVGKVYVLGGTINSNSDYSYGIYNASNGEIEMTGGQINGECVSGYNVYGIYNNNNGIIKIEGGTISSNGDSYYISYGIYNNNINGTVIIGKNENATISQENPKIQGEIGISNKSGNTEFYNGIIQGTIIPLSGTITKIKEKCKIENSNIDGKDSIYIIKIENNNEDIVQVENTKYTSLQKAINEVKDNEEKTIQVIKDFEISEEIEFSKNIILDLNGHSIKNNYYKICNIGNLKITDTTGTKEGKVECKNTIFAITNKENGNIEIQAGLIKIDGYDTNYGIYNENTGTIQVNGGQISTNSSHNSSYGIYNLKDGNIKLTKGIINSNGSGRYTTYGIYNKDIGTIEITGTEINITGGWSSCGVYNSKGKISMSDGVINCYNNSGLNGSASGISNNSSYGSVEMIGGTININALMEATGIFNYGTLTIIGGTINSISRNWDQTYGIYNSSSGTTIVGTKGDGIISKEIPNIKAQYTTGHLYYDDGYGIYNTSGKLYYYDGIIQGTTKAVYYTITEIEDDTELSYNEDETILTLTTEIANIAQVGEKTYKDIQLAIDSVDETQSTIKILRDATYTKQSSILIPNTKNIILDLNGCKITSSVSESLIQNEGMLEIVDTSETQTGILVSSTQKTINNVNGAKLTLSGGTIENRKETSIYNEGELKIQSGIVNCNNEDDTVYGIYNANSGSVEVTGGKITFNGDDFEYCSGIYNASTGVVKITGGIINGISSRNYGIYNEKTGIVEMTGGIITSRQYYTYGIYNKGTGTVKVTGGTIISNGNRDNRGIYNATTGTIIIGTKGDGTISEEMPNILATYKYDDSGYGIYNLNGKLYYYDGIIKGTNRAIMGKITEIEDSTELIILTETEDYECEAIKLEQKSTNVAKVNETEYDSIEKAIQACGTTESEIKILRDVNPGESIVIEQNQNIIIDLSGYTVKNYPEMTNRGTLKIIDSSTERTGKIIGLTGTAVFNEGTMELNSGSIADSGYGIKNTGTLNITGGKITGNTYGVYNNANGKVTMANGEISLNTYGIYNYSTNSVNNINGGYIQSNEYGIYNYNGTTNILSKGIADNTYGIYNANGTTNIKEGAEIQSNTGIYVAKGTANIGETGTMNSSSPVITGEEYGLSVTSIGTVNMYDGQIKGKTGATQGFITNTEEGYTVATRTEGEYTINYLALSGTADSVAEVNGINYSNLQSAINSITGSEEQTIKLTNGIITSETFTISEGQNIILNMNGKTISSDLEVTLINNGNLTIIDTSGKNVAKISSTKGTAIKNTGTLTLGEDDGTENPDLIILEGANQGLNNTGTLNKYDGTIN